MIGGLKVVTAAEMVKTEKGGDAEWFMERAGRSIADAALAFVEAHKHLPKVATLFVGCGNNGGDAYAAGLYLLDHGFKIHVISLPGKVSPLNRKMRDRLYKKGSIGSGCEGIILDGLLGTGFKGKVEGELEKLIHRANHSGLPILAIDIPSGVNGTSGEASTAIIASETISLGLPKIGCFVKNGWAHTGRLHVVDFGLSKEAIAAADAVAYIPQRLHLPPISRTRHKYEAGYVVGLAGSSHFPGSAKLAGRSALRGGAGIVRIFSTSSIGECPHELIFEKWTAQGWKAALAKAKSVFVGPGLGENANRHLKSLTLPCVIDADALVADAPFPKGAILTPHRGEALRLLDLKHELSEEELFAKIIRFVKTKQVTLVLKGAPTFIFAPSLKPIIIPRGDPGMATAGTGDVLTGLIAGILAQSVPPIEASILGASLHGIAGEEAARQKTSYCMIASDLIQCLPFAFRFAMEGHIPNVTQNLAGKRD